MPQSEYSRPVTSNQSGLHPRLAQTVTRHLQHAFQRPVAPHSHNAYQTLTERLTTTPQPLVIDSFCGTGMSTAQLAAKHPDHLIVGIDQSSHRLQKHVPGTSDNYIFLHAEAEDIWQLLLADGRSADFHYLLYPNPWPKSKHLQRRIHGHASFPWLLALGGHIELRSNWQNYVEEFGVAMHLAGVHGRIAQVPEAPALTLFEKKYRDSQHNLWRYTGAVTNPA